MNEQLCIFEGRPEGEQSPRKTACYDFLDSLSIPYKRAEHQPADTVELCALVEALYGQPICKNLFLCNRQQTEFYLVVMPGDKKFKTKDVSAQLNTARLSFASAAQLEEYLNVLPGSVSIFALLFDKEKRVHLAVDDELKGQENLLFHPCDNTATLQVSAADVFGVFLPAVGHTPAFVTLPREEEA